VALAASSAVGSGMFIITVVLAAVTFSTPDAISVDPVNFKRDLLVYLVAVLLLTGVLMDSVIGIVQSVILALYYCLYLGYVFYTSKVEIGSASLPPAFDLASTKGGASDAKGTLAPVKKRREYHRGDGSASDELINWMKWQVDWDNMTPGQKYMAPFTVPVQLCMALTMPEVCEATITQSYALMLALCGPVFFLLSGGVLPLLGSVLPFNAGIYVLICCVIAAVGAFVAVPKEQGVTAAGGIPAVITFIQSVMWMHFAADQMVGLLEAAGRAFGMSDAFLGATLLAWGNCIGDFVTCLSVARAGQVGMAVAAVFAGPLFNLLGGMSIALLFENINVGVVEVVISNSTIILHAFIVITLAYIIFAVHTAKFELPKLMGAILLVMYGLFSITYTLTEVGWVFPGQWMSA